MSGLPWFRMYTDFLNDPKMISLAFEDQRHFIAILALKADGAIDHDCENIILDRIVAQRLWIEFAIIGDVKKRLMAADLIDEKWQPLAWEKRQKKSDHDAAERKRKQRAKQKIVTDEVNVTSMSRDSHVLDKIRIDKNREDKIQIPSEQKTVHLEITDCPHKEIIELYGELLPNLRQPRLWDGERAKTLAVRWKYLSVPNGVTKGYKTKIEGLDFWRRFFKYIAEKTTLPDGYKRKEGGIWQPDLPWLIKSENFKNIVEGKYDK